jgi:hypothetical protein
VELLNLLTGQPAAVALAILAMYWLNRNTLDFAREKRELLDIIRTERKEWLDGAREERRELIDISRSSIDADKQVAHELHALRQPLTDIRLDIQWLKAKLGGEPSRKTPGGT